MLWHCSLLRGSPGIGTHIHDTENSSCCVGLHDTDSLSHCAAFRRFKYTC